jgi:hypothetical protein
MKTERLRVVVTRQHDHSRFGIGTLLLTLLVAPIVVGAALLLPRAALLGATSAGADVATTTSSQSATQDGGGSPLTFEAIKALFKAQAAKPRFDGTVNGWRIATYGVLEAAGISDRNLARSCEPYEAGAKTPTQLDFAVGYLPSDLKLGPVSEPDKWLCGTEGLSVEQVYDLHTPLGAGHIWIARSIEGRPALEMDAPADSVDAATINGNPAIFFHQADDATGLGMGRVVVIEDNTGPEFTILSVTADNGVPFAELVKIAEGIK